MERPLNIPPDIWKKKYNNGILEKPQKEEKEESLDDYTKINNSIDQISEGIVNFKETFDRLLMSEFSDEDKKRLENINDLFEQAIIPYTIKIIEEFNEINKEK